MATTFYVGGTNFTDLYYPSAGPSVTSVTGVCTAGFCTVGNVGAACSDGRATARSRSTSTRRALSIGRGRRDIENLTQAANIDIPVIAFGGTQRPRDRAGRLHAVRRSIGVVHRAELRRRRRAWSIASTPNPAFPTFGGVAGGFEVVMAEGFAHLDVVTAEDNADNPVPAALVAFLQRNIQ